MKKSEAKDLLAFLDQNRRAGTSHLIATAALSTDRLVYIVMGTQNMADCMKDRLRDMGGWDPQRVKVVTLGSLRRCRGMAPGIVLLDTDAAYALAVVEKREEKDSAAESAPPSRCKITVEYLDPTPEGVMREPTVLDFDELHFHQHRPVHKEFDPVTGRCTKMTPDRMTTTMITGHKMNPAV